MDDQPCLTPSNLDSEKEECAILNYIIENCLFAYDELCKVNGDLILGMDPDSDVDVNHLGAMNRMIQDYLIIRVGNLFDKTKGVVSFDKIFSGNKDYIKIKEEEEIIKYIMEQRNNFVAHTNIDFIKNSFPITEKIVSSNLKQLLEKMQELLGNC